MSIRDNSRRLFCNIKWCSLRSKPGCLYSSTYNGLFTRFMPTKYHHFASFRLSTYMYVLFCMRESRKFCQKGSNSDNVFFCCVFFFFFVVFFFFFLMRRELMGGGGGPNIAISGPSSAPSSARQQNAIEMDRMLACFFRGSRPVLLRCTWSVCASVQLEIYTVLKIRIRSQKYGHLFVLHFILY